MSDDRTCPLCDGAGWLHGNLARDRPGIALIEAAIAYADASLKDRQLATGNLERAALALAKVVPR